MAGRTLGRLPRPPRRWPRGPGPPGAPGPPNGPPGPKSGPPPPNGNPGGKLKPRMRRPCSWPWWPSWMFLMTISDLLAIGTRYIGNLSDARVSSRGGVRGGCQRPRIWQSDTCADGADSPARRVRARGGREDPRPRPLRRRSDRRAGGRPRAELVAFRRADLRLRSRPAGRVADLVRRASRAGVLQLRGGVRLRRRARRRAADLLIDHRPLGRRARPLGPPRRALGAGPRRAAQPAAAGRRPRSPGGRRPG